MYNGHKSWNHWNVFLWLSNDEGLYNMVRDCVRRSHTKDEAAQMILDCLHDGGIIKTPDGAPYTKTAIRAALTDF